ncbi:MAG TPA: DUF5818 domain-containing protein [Alphaproteobacteria bacterium]|jgi:hypothetical protein|nr:DUF5818 domain-containing protein [Alphaproteobacteria bacterium]
MRVLALIGVLVAISVAMGSALAESAAPAKDGAGEVCVRGRLTEGAECPALRTAEGTVYSLARGGPALAKDGEICVCGRKAEVSICQQGITLTAVRLGQPGDCR